MRTSSMRPGKYSLPVLAPPMRSGFADVRMLALRALVATWTPLTYNRSVAPSKVTAM